MRVLVACGAAGGIAATFNAPLAGVFFAMELILADFAAAVVRHGGAGLGHRQRHRPGRPGQHAVPAPAAVRGRTTSTSTCCSPCSGCSPARSGVGFTRVLYAIEDACDWVWRGPEWLRPAVGGLLLGGLLLVLPEMYGVGYPVLGRRRRRRRTPSASWSCCWSARWSPPASPSASAAPAVSSRPACSSAPCSAPRTAQLCTPSRPASPARSGAYGLIGMGAVFAGAARAPITAVVIMFELTGEYTIILPLMAAIVLATGSATCCRRDTIYTLKLRRRGVDLSQPAPWPGGDETVGAVMEPVTAALSDDTTLIAAAEALRGAPYGQLPTVDPSGRYRGVVTVRAVTQALAEGDAPSTPVSALCELPSSIRADAQLEAALTTLETAQGPVAVLDPTGVEVVGWLTHRDVLAVLVGKRGTVTAVTTPRPTGSLLEA